MVNQSLSFFHVFVVQTFAPVQGVQIGVRRVTPRQSSAVQLALVQVL